MSGVVEALRWLRCVADRTGVDFACMALQGNRLFVVTSIGRGSNRMGATVTGDALDPVVPNGIAVEHARLFILVSRFVMTTSASRLIDPRGAGRTCQRLH